MSKPQIKAAPRTRALAWGLGGVCVVGYVCLTVLALLHDAPGALSRAASGLSVGVLSAALGTLLALRQPANAIGWLLTSGALVWLGNDVADYLVTPTLESGADLGSALGVVAVFNEWIWPVAVLCSLGLPLVLFPDGRVRSTRWRWVLWTMLAGAGATTICGVLITEPLPNAFDPAAPIDNPLGIAALAGVTRAGSEVAPAVFVGMMALALASIVRRSRSATGTARQQLRWVSSGALLAIAGVLVFPIGEWLSLPDGVITLVFTICFGCVPMSITVAVLRYRLYDLDRVVSRTVAYGAVTGLLVATYAGLVTAVSRLTPSGSSLAVASSTLAVAALFQPVRRRVQTSVDRRFNRTRYDAARTVEDFRLRLRDEVDLHAVRTDLLAVVHQSVQPNAAGLWLRAPAAGLRTGPGSTAADVG